MGNICSDNPYNQLKELYPRDLQKFIETSELQKKVSSNITQKQAKLNSQIDALQSQRLDAIDAHKHQVKDHFQKVKQEVDKSYPGGVSFLQKGKNKKIQDLLGFTLAEKQYNDISQMSKKQFEQGKQSANQKLKEVKAEELKNLPVKPVLDKFNVLPQKDKSSIYAQGLSQVKGKIDEKTKSISDNISKKLGFDSLLDKLKNLVPNDKLLSLTSITKQQITKNAANFIGSPNEGKATLY